MPTKKIRDLEDDEPKSWGFDSKRCFHPEHHPPTMYVFEPGHYEHICPACGNVIAFTVRRGVTL